MRQISSVCERHRVFDRSYPVAQKQLYNILYTVSTQQRQYSDIMYAIGYTVHCITILMLLCTDGI